MTTYSTIADSEIDPESPGTTTLFTKLRDNPLSIAEGDATAPSISSSAIGNQLLDLYYLGSGSDGAKTVASSENLVSGEYHYTDLTVNSGQTLGVSSTYGGLVIRCTGTATIAGIISANSKGGAGGTAGLSMAGGHGGDGELGGSGGSGGADGSYDSGAGGDVIIRNSFISGGAAKTTDSGGNAGTSLAATTPAVRSITAFSNGLIPLYAGGGGGGGSGTGDPGAGGRGGGFVIIIADTIDFQSGASITARGGNGSASVNDGGGGGGGGGVVILAAKTITNEGTITVTGGSGGSGISTYSGGAGGAGYSTVITVT